MTRGRHADHGGADGAVNRCSVRPGTLPLTGWEDVECGKRHFPDGYATYIKKNKATGTQAVDTAEDTHEDVKSLIRG